MNLSVSNIGWNQSENKKAIDILKSYQISNVDVSPSLINDEIENDYNKADIKMVGMQSLLYTCPPVSLFDGEIEKQIILNHLKEIFKLANRLKIKPLVFGSPKNRFIKDFNNFKIEKAIEIFKEIGDMAKTFDCIVCLEANAKEYGCNFITNTTEAINFINNVKHENLKLVLDISTTIFNSESLEHIFENGASLIEHIHISSPYLKSIDTLKNKEISSVIKKYNYNKYVTLECNLLNNETLDTLINNVEIFSEAYG
jgi:sugar phosphate isomerase/epimerase